MEKYRFKFYMNAKHYVKFDNNVSNIHPHTWELVLFIQQVNEGFVEFTTIEKYIEDYLSHYECRILNEIFPFDNLNPTMENIGRVIYKNVETILEKNGWELIEFEVSENPTRTYIIEKMDGFEDLINLEKIIPNNEQEQKSEENNWLKKEIEYFKQNAEEDKMKQKRRKSRLKLAVSFIIAIAMILIMSNNVFASSISLDGDFNDWNDKATITNPVADSNDNIQNAKWASDNNNLYLYYQRDKNLNKNGSKSDWDITTKINTDLGPRTIEIHYDPASQQTEIKVMDQNGQQVYNDKGKYGEKFKDGGTQVEVDIPFNTLTSNPESGYQIDISNGNGTIIVSTASTTPWFIIFVLILIGPLTYIYMRRKPSKEGNK